MPQACQPCKERGRFAVALRIVEGTPMCDACFTGKDEPGEAASKGGKMRTCKYQGCDKRLTRANKSGYCTAHFYESKRKQPKGVTARSSRARRAAKAANALPTLIATPELVEHIWSTLPLEQKAALVNKLAEA